MNIKYFLENKINSKMFYKKSLSEVELRPSGVTYGKHLVFNYGFIGDLSFYPARGFFNYSGVRGGGKCPEEEHTTCSGGRTIIIVTSAVYGERNIYKNINILINIK